MAYNKVIKKDGTVMLDLTNTTVSEETLAKNITAVDKYGNKIIGTLTDSPLPIEVSTEEEMNTLLERGEVGSIYKYVGITGTYENGCLYEITEESDPLIGTWVLNQSDFVNFPYPAIMGTGFNISGYTYNDNQIIAHTYDHVAFSSADYLYLVDTTSESRYELILDKTYPFYFITYDDIEYDLSDDVIIRQQISTFTINSYPTNETDFINILLTFLQANATKQLSKSFTKLVIQIGTLDINANGEYNVTEYANANVNIINTLQYVMDNNGDTPPCQYLFSYWQGTDPTLSFTGVDTSNVTDMSYMFFHCPNLTTIPLFDTSNVTNMYYMFDTCTNLTTIPLLDTSSVTNMSYMFANCTNLTTIPLLDTSNVTNMRRMFMDCTNLISIPQLDTSNVTDMYYMFDTCTNLTSIPQLDTSNVTDMGYMFYYCTNLTSIPQLDTSKVTDMIGMFAGCTNLTTIPQLDTSKVTSMSWMFGDCTNLKTILMYGMKTSFNISASTQFETDDLVTILNNLATVSSTTTLTMGETNLAKLSDEQKQIAIDKGWTLA